MIALCPKSYSIHCNNIEETKDGRKGIPNYVELRTMEFFDILYGEPAQKHKVEVRSLRLNKERHMARTATIKSGLSTVHVKLQVCEDKVTCQPLRYSDGSFV